MKKAKQKVGGRWLRRGPYCKWAVAKKMREDLAHAGMRAKLRRSGRDRWVVLFRAR